MKYIKLFLLLAVAVLTGACSSDDVSSESIFKPTETKDSEFDKWLSKTYTEPYNIQFNYLYNDYLTNRTYNVVPATISNSKAMAILIKHVWLDAYKELMGDRFLKGHCFRVFQMIGSGQYNPAQGSVVLGTAEGGIQVTLFQVNALDPDNIYLETKDPFRPLWQTPLDLNKRYFHTMHHEFTHILTQLRDYSTDFRTVSAGKYTSTGWGNVDDSKSAKMGFVTGYASSEYNEDFAETFSTYVTFTDEMWNKLLDSGVADKDTSGRDAILKKLEILRVYFKESWGVDIDKLRTIVLRRSQEAAKLDLKTLK